MKKMFTVLTLVVMLSAAAVSGSATPKVTLPTPSQTINLSPLPCPNDMPPPCN